MLLRKVLCTGLVLAVMLCAMSWTAEADIVGGEILNPCGSRTSQDIKSFRDSLEKPTAPGTSGGSVVRTVMLAGVLVVGTITLFVMKRKTHRQSISYVGLMMLVMVMLCLMSWTADADILKPDPFWRRAPRISQDLQSPSDAPGTSGGSVVRIVMLAGVLVVGTMMLLVMKRKTRRQSISYVGLMVLVMVMLCLMKWTARADVADPEIFVRDVPGASFDLSTSDNALMLTITPHTSGDVSYSFVLVSGDSKHAEDSDSGYYSYVESEDVRASFVYGVPEDGESLHYEIAASFFPRMRPEPEPDSEDVPVPDSEDVPVPDSEDRSSRTETPIVSQDITSTSGGGSSGCSPFPEYVAPESHYFVHINYVSAYFTASADVHNVGGTVYVELHKGE